jgi:hypothetical protein
MKYGNYEEDPGSKKSKIGTNLRDVFIAQTTPMDENGYFNWDCTIHAAICRP